MVFFGKLYFQNIKNVDQAQPLLTMFKLVIVSYRKIRSSLLFDKNFGQQPCLDRIKNWFIKLNFSKKSTFAETILKFPILQLIEAIKKKQQWKLAVPKNFIVLREGFNCNFHIIENRMMVLLLIFLLNKKNPCTSSSEFQWHFGSFIKIKNSISQQKGTNCMKISRNRTESDRIIWFSLWTFKLSF